MYSVIIFQILKLKCLVPTMYFRHKTPLGKEKNTEKY